MDALTAWVLIAGLTATSIAARGSFILFLARLEVPRPVQRGLRFVPAAVFTALLVPELAFAGGSLSLGPHNPKLVAALVAAPIAWWTRNTIATILAGMVALHLAGRYLV
jgi:branched-subunit amino acid transport protein